VVSIVSSSFKASSGLSLISGLPHALDDRLLAGDPFLSFHDVARGHGQRGFVTVFHGVTFFIDNAVQQ
jgi:hypothetical protein